MRCQLARIVNPPESHHNVTNWFIWVQANDRPSPGYLKYNPGLSVLHFFDRIKTPYTSNNPLGVGLSNAWIERLPIFRDVEPYPAEEWFAKGGETLPIEELPEESLSS